MSRAARAPDPTVRRLAALTTSLRWWIVAAAAVSFVTLAAGLGLIATSGYLISRSALVDTTATLALAIVMVRFFAVVRAAGRYVERYVGHLATFRMLTMIRVWFYRGIEPLAPAALVDEQSGQVLTRIVDDVETLQELPLRVLVPRAAAALAGATGVLVLALLSPQLGVVLGVLLLVSGVAMPALMRRMGVAAAETLVHEKAALQTTAVEGVSGLADLVAYGREDLLTGRIGQATRRRRAAEQRLARLRGVNAAIAAGLTGLAAVATLAMAIPLVTDGRLEGVLLAVVPLATLATFEAVAPLAVSYEHVDRSRVAAGRLFTLVDRPQTVSEPSDPGDGFSPADVLDPRGEVTFERVTFRYHPHRPDVLVDASFQVAAGAQVAFVGPSGAGKSTIPSLLLRFWEPQQGTIRLDGADLRELGSDHARAAVAVVAQHDHLFDTTIRDNLLLGAADADDGRLRAVCRAVALDEFLHGLPMGLDERAGEDGRRLSGGERQRVMIARALLTDAPVLVLDEATAHLDSETERKVLAGVRAWRGGRTTIHIGHDTSVLGPLDLVLRVQDGRLHPELAAESTA